MKSILKGAALLSAAVLIASCDSNSGGRAVDVNVAPPPPPAVGISGSAVKGTIDGATIQFLDANGNVVGSSAVTAGQYSVDLAGAIGTGVPVITSVSGGTTVCDYDNPDNSGNDCVQADGTFVAFGTPYPFPGSIRSLVPTTGAAGISHVSSLSELAAAKAEEAAGAGVALTPASIAAANAAVTGLIETLTGIDLGGVDITQIATADLNATAGVSPEAAAAVAAFNAGILASQAAGETIAQTIVRIASGVTIDANGNLSGSGTNLAVLTNALATGLAVAADKTGNDVITNTVATVQNLAQVYANTGAGTVTIIPPGGTGSDASVDLTKEFVQTLSAVLGQVASATGAQGFGGATNVGATEAFATELDAIAGLTSGNATKAFNALDSALKTAATGLANGASVTNAAQEPGSAGDDAVSFVLTRSEDGSTLTATDVTAVWPKVAAAGNQVVLTAATATSNSSTSTVSIPAVTIVSTTATNTQTFTGSASNSVGSVAGTEDLALNGSITTSSSAGTSYSLSATLTGNPTQGADAGAYSVILGFISPTANDISLRFNGNVGESAQNFAIAGPAGTITGSVTRPAGAGDNGNSDAITLTDGTAVLTLNALSNGNLVANSAGLIGTFSVGTTQTGTLKPTGQVDYTDGTIQFLPAIIFPE